MSADPEAPLREAERLRRWRLLLGSPAEESLGFGSRGSALDSADRGIDAALAALYDAAPDKPRRGGQRSAGLGASAPTVARWLGDIRAYFPSSVVQVMQR